jgi:surface polysaccharide O-acyltransferase-like enzyme
LTVSGLALIPLIILSYRYRIRFGAFGDHFQLEYFHQDLIGNIIISIFVLFWISLLYFLTIALKDWKFATLKRWSRNITVIYFIHWVILGILCQIILEPIDIWVVVVLAAAVLSASDLLAYLFLKYKANRRTRQG